MESIQSIMFVVMALPIMAMGAYHLLFPQFVLEHITVRETETPAWGMRFTFQLWPEDVDLFILRAGGVLFFFGGIFMLLRGVLGLLGILI